MTRLRLARFAGLVLAFAGYWLPWVSHRAAGLVVAAVDLPEFPKFMPQVRGGELVVWREAFYMPLLALGLGLALWAGKAQRLSPVARWALRAIALFLPVMPSVFNVLEPGELQTQLRLSAIVLAAIVLVALWRRLPLRAPGVALAAVFALGAVAPVWQFLHMKPALDTIYGKPVDIGVGVWATVGGFGWLAALEIAGLWRRGPSL